MAFGLSHFFAGRDSNSIAVPNSFCYETVGLEMLTAKERRRYRSQPVPISQEAHRHEEIRASCIPYRLQTELQPAAAQCLGMIKLSCKVSTSC